MTEGSPTETTQMKASPMSPIEDWTNDDVIGWINKVYGDKPKRQKVLVESIKENEYTGEELLSCADYEELMDALEISKKIIAKDLFKKMQQVKDNAIADIVALANSKAHLRKNQSKAKLSNTQDLDYLIKIYEGLFPIKRENDIKEDEVADNGPIQKFVEMVKNSGHSIKEFVKSLMNFGYANDITKRIIHICMTYYQLLDDTLTIFTAYGGSIKNLSRCMAEISNIFLLPIQVKNSLDKLDTKSKQKMLIKLRESTCAGLQKATKKYKLLLDKIDEVHVRDLKTLGKKWTFLYRRILNLLNSLKAHKNKVGKSNKDSEKVFTTMDRLKSTAKYAGGFCLKWIAAPLTFGLGCVAAGVIGAAGIAAAVTGVGIPVAVGCAAAYAGTCVATVAATEKLMNKGNQLMNKGGTELDQMKKVRKTEDNIKQIELMQDSLERMANVSFAMSNVIKMELHNFEKIKENDPDAEIRVGGFTDFDAFLTPNNRILNRIQKLGESIMNSTKYLDKSKMNIVIVENTCQAELENFGKYIHTPLLKMLTAKQKQERENSLW